MLHRRKKSFFSSSDNSSGRFNHPQLKEAINKKRIEKLFHSKEKDKKLINKINKKESKASTFIKTYGSLFIGVISLIYLVKLIFNLFKKEYLQLDTFFLFSGFLLLSLLVTLFSIKRFYSKRRGNLKFLRKTLNISIVFIFISVTITTVGNPTNYLNKIKIDDLVSIQIKSKNLRLNSSKYSRIYIDSYNYPSFYFKIKNIHQFDYKSFVNETKKNTILNIKIAKKDLNRKLTKNEELSFWDKHFNYDEILVYELSKNNKKLLNFSQTNTNTSDLVSLILLIVFNGLLIISSIILILDVFSIKTITFLS